MKTRRLIFASISLSLLVPGLLRAADAPVYQDASAPLERRVDDLFGRLTPDEKLSLLGGTGFAVEAVPRLGVPKMAMADAGQGVRGGEPATEGPATAFPAGVLMASTWDTNLIRQVGQAIGEEAANKGTGARVLLGPAVNIHRTPLGGRNGEYFSEDPYLAARLAVAYIQGMQGTGISACVKHFACNNQENDRDAINATVSERALREIYLPAFEAAVKEGKVWSIMSSYNLVNGHHSSANSFLLKDVLKTDWGFDGEVMSDWGGVHEADVVQFGNDLEMPTGANMSVAHLKSALADGSVTQAAVDDSVRRILRTVIRVGLLDGPIQQNPAMVNSPAHQQLALDAAEHGIVLLKNSHAVLPLDSKRVKSIAVIGEPAQHMQFDALGSPEVRPLHVVEFLDAIKARAGDATAVTYAAARLDGKPFPAPGSLPPYADAIAAAKNADVAIVCVSTRRMEGEGNDRPSMDLPANQAGLIRAVAAANKNTVVVLNNGTPVTMKDWLANVPAVVETWFPGQEGGTALAAILFGDVNPSGKLPDTLAASREDYPDFGNYPGANHQVNYAEGIYIGYRHFDRAGIAPLFPFGYGLSYTTFGYHHLRLSKKELSPDGSVTASVDITNTGKRAGEEVVELYIHDPKPQIDKPVRELKGFAKVALNPGETKTVQFTVQPRALAYFDTPGHQWKADAGDYEIQIGASSRDLRQKAVLHLTADYTDKMASAK
jgi:beta-glucosidase